MNYILITSLVAIMVAQVVKFPIAYLFKSNKTTLNIVTSTGGMPSSHSAAVSSLITSLILEYGFNSPLVAIAAVFGVIIMFDSMAVRRQSGEQGIILEVLRQEYLDKQIAPLLSDEVVEDNPNLSDYDEDSLKDLLISKYLGHKPSEVLAGSITGGLVSIVCRYWIFV